MYDQHEPLFPFGHGLSYTSFDYSNLELPNHVIHEDQVIHVHINIAYAGDMEGDEVTQLYVRYPESNVERPSIALKGFKGILIKTGESRQITIPLHANELRFWDIDKHAFILEPGMVEIMIGASSSDIRLRGKIMTE